MADESEAGGAGLRELYADSDSGDDFIGFNVETVPCSTGRDYID